MPNTSNITMPLNGMNTDVHQLNTNEQTYPFAYNAMIEDFWTGQSNFIQNEPSNTCSVQFPPNYQVAGFVEIPEQNRTIYLLTNPKNGNCQIGEVLNCQYKNITDKIEKVFCKNCSEYSGHEQTPLEDRTEHCFCDYLLITPANCLKLNVNYHVDIEYRITNCGINIYYTDAINERRFTYFDYTNNDPTKPLKLQDRFKIQIGDTGGNCPEPIYINELDCEKIKIHPNYNRPCVKFVTFTNGGNLKAGDYEVLVAYSDIYGNPMSQYFPSSGIASLFEKQITFDTNYITNQALKFNIEGLKNDSLFQYYNIVIAQTIENFTEFILVGTFSTTQVSYVYTGFERTLKRLTAQEVFFRRPFYKTAKSVTTANNYLFFGDVKEYKTLNLQPIANKIHLQWETVALKEGAYYDPRNVFYFRTYTRDEVIPIGIVFEYANGRETCAFHIPGRAATFDDLAPICNDDLLDIDNCEVVLTCPSLTANISIECGTVHFHDYKTLTIEVVGLASGETYDISFDGGTTYQPTDTGLSNTNYYINLITNTNPTYDVVMRRHCLLGGTSLSSTYHVVVNRSACTQVTTTLPTPQDVLCKPRYEVYNTASVVGTPHDYNENCELDKCWEYGEFAYWQSTERYPVVPEVWGELCGQFIRHHKMPDCCITHIHDGKDANKEYKDANYIFPIGIRIDHEQIKTLLDQAVVDGLLTADERADIVSYRILRGNRLGNKSIDAKGLIFNMLTYTKDSQNYYAPNYSYNDLTTDDFLDGVSIASSERFTFHSPDVHFRNAHIGNILKVETEEYGQTEGYFTYSDCQPKYKFLNNFAHVLAFGLGLAAAISATGEKECKVITYKSKYNINNLPYGDVSQATYVLASGSGTVPPIITTKGTGDAIEEHNTEPYDIYNPTTGINVPGGAGDAESKQITTCTGQPFQLFNSNPVITGLLGGINVGGIIQRTLLGIIEMNKVLDTLRELIPEKNYSVQYNSVGKYNNYTCPTIENINRVIIKTAYLEPYIQNVDEPSGNPGELFTTTKINNFNRESSVYLRLKDAIIDPSNIDNSKVSMDNAGLGVGDLNKPFNRSISAYYVSLKNQILNQYGQICNIDYLETNGCSFFLNRTYNSCETKVFGGDTFINRFALKRKMPFFLHNMCNLPNGSDVLYSELGNVGTPKFYFNTPQPLADRITSLGLAGGIFSSITTENLHNYDVQTSHLFHQEGYVPLFSYGIPYFFVESDINVDYRHGENNKDKDFYPHNKDLKTWLEEANTPISVDNFYKYNFTYSKQNHESVICTSCILNYHDFICQNQELNKLIYSEPTDTENKNDNWLIFKANNYWNFPLTKGKFISADGIENDKVLVRLEQGTQIFPAYNTIQATEENIQVGTGGLFKTHPQDIAVTDLGYAGTTHRDILHTEYGHIWADAAHGQIFNLSTGGQGMDELTKTGMKAWFKENLPFQLVKDFPNFTNIDNNLNGVGLHYCFDRRFNRILITKLDYKKQPNVHVQYNATTNKFETIIDEVTKTVDLKNPKYFCNKSWTVSYNFFTKSWTSFHSYTPDFYVEHINSFESATSFPTMINGTLGRIHKLYTHNATNKSYQVFYGKLEPFIVEFQAKQALVNNVINSVEYYLDVIRFHNEFDTFYNRTKTFNKAIIYNERQTSGLLEFTNSNPEDLSEVLHYPKRTTLGYNILTTNSENIWRFNGFYDVAANQLNNVPIFNYDCNNVNKQLNNKALDYNKNDFDKAVLRQRMCRVRLINDKESNYKYIFNFAQVNQKQSFR